MAKKLIKGLYAITPNELDTAELIRKTRLALQGDATVLQYRNKLANADLQLAQATALRQLTREFASTFIVNDNVQLAAQVDADGVHLGGEDGSIEMARQLLGAEKIIGVSCYNRAPLALAKNSQLIDYIAFGAFFSSSTKPDAAQAELDLLHWAKQNISIPVVAIGGITLQNAPLLINAGADALAVISAVFDAEDIQVTAQQFSTLFKQGLA
ncbi:MAG: thiamine phosphate synthase [Gallionellaceae bacterium]|nr:thiamine phosphate synthase [Gallionellaceae bacterium]